MKRPQANSQILIALDQVRGIVALAAMDSSAQESKAA
jgi:hypothetical protein